MQRSALVALSCLAFASSALAEEEALPNFAEDTLTGDWGGARSAAAQSGFLFEGGAKIDALSNHGGQSNGSKRVSHLDLKLKMDLDKAAGWSGGSALINMISDGGWGPNARHVGGQMGVTNIEVGAPTTTRLFQAWLQQGFLDDRLAVLAGLYPIDSEFFTMDSAGVLLGPQYGTPADLAQTRGPSIFNNSAFGLRARWTLDKTLYAMGAVLDGIPNDPARPRSTAIRFAKGDGSFTIGEFGWLPEAANDKFKGHAKAALGFWSYSSKVSDQRDTDAAGSPLRRRQLGGYVLGERTLMHLGGNEERFLSGFARYTWTDGDSTQLKNSLNLGLHIRGPVESRPDDVIGAAWTRAALSGKWRDVQPVPAVTKSSEDVLEITYRYALTPWFAIQPNYQYIRNPGGTTAPNAQLIGVRLELAL
ncbi:MAG: carbohydrate porin [Rhodocyclales bacterium]|nr:carbohydrate porin [Rhodocyclales bacterium]